MTLTRTTMMFARPAKEGYIRARDDLRILDSSAVACSDPFYGYLDLLTEDGRLRLKLTRSCAQDLLVDLKQFLANQRQVEH